MKTNTHGLKMHGLRKAAGDTKGLNGYYSGQYVQINYDTVEGMVWTNYHYSLGHSSWTHYDCPTVITVCTTSVPMTMQAIADAVYEAVSCLRYIADTPT